ncbi:PREDICTED: uncharacterized protein LOC109192712 [Ipomoea nil]|uniref:uncharacterized protein LOC109192712 n=1 Tax=Ipomoea nil TaxID=35883 RepID=UPI0009013929|nr:PREDICTED: uncharacterized protein LOC109192712 [Ipomoea nil]
MQPRRTYAESVASQTLSIHAQQQPTFGGDDDGEDSDDEADDDPLCPTIRLTKEELEIIRAPWRRALIVKVMGRTVGYAYLLRRLNSIWKPKGSLDLIALDNGYFLVKFGSMDDLAFAMFEGPWMVLDHYLIVKEWEPDFDPTKDTTKNILVWVRIPILPVEYYNFIFLRKLGNRIGRTVRVDQATSLVSRGKFVRICVEVDMRKPLISKFTYKGRVRYVSYEGIHMVCFACGVYGHSTEACPLSREATANPEGHEAEQTSDERPPAREPPGTPYQAAQDPKLPFGAWILAPKRGGRTNARQSNRHQRSEGNRRNTGVNRKSAGAQSSRFAPLREENVEEEVDMGDEAGGEQDITAGGAQANASVSQAEPRHNSMPATEGGRQRRPNVIASEKRVANEPMAAQNLTNNVEVTKSKGRRELSEGSRRAAEENEHLVVRGEKGGLVISATHVISDNTAEDIPSPVWQSTKEHPNDPPRHLDDEGDVVMDIEEGPVLCSGVGDVGVP